MNNPTSRPTLDDYLAMQYRLDVIADPDGGFVLEYPDLPGCMTQVESLAEVGDMAEEVRRLWLETAYDHGMEIPLPSYPEEYSGKFNLRLPKSLHRRLAAAAARDDVSLNQYVVGLLSEGVATKPERDVLQALVAGQEQMRAELSNLSSQFEEARDRLTTKSAEREAGARMPAQGGAVRSATP